MVHASRSSVGELPDAALDPSAARWAARGIVATCWFAILASTVVFAGWLTDSMPLKTGFTGHVSMKANASVALFCLGVALLLLRPVDRPRWRTRLGAGLAAIAATIGGLTLLQHVAGVDLGIDQLLFAEVHREAATTSPNRMGPPACSSLFALGTALLLLDRDGERWRGVPQAIALLVALLTMLSLLGYLTGATQLYGVARFTGIALHTALALCLLSLAVLLARPFAPPANVLLAANAGGQLARTLLPVTVLLPLVLTVLRIRGEELGWYDQSFGRALLLLFLIVTFTVVVWLLAVRFSSVAAARTRAEQASDRARAEAERLATENLQTLSVLDSLLAHAPVGLVFFERSGRCVRVNDLVARIHGEGAEALTGRDVRHVLPGNAQELDDRLERVFAGKAEDMELVRSEADGEDEGAQRVWLASLFPVRDSDGKVRVAGAIMLEITERKRLEAQRTSLLESERAARTESQRAARLKDEFLATLSHELRTPLNSILGWVTLAQGKQGVTPELKRALDIVERNARLQAQLIEDLLDVSRIESGKMRLDVQPVDTRTAIMGAVSAITPALEAKRIRLETNLSPTLNEVLGDAARLQQILWNLLSNAMKFTPAGGHIQVQEQRVGTCVEVSVKDSGIGIHPEFLPHVFDRFRQADGGTTRRHGGLGLGLSIVRQLVEAHGGTVRAESAGENQGATFVVSLPLASAHALAEHPRLEREHADQTLEGVRVLVVDDERDARDFVARVLLDREAIVDTASGVDEALALVERRAPDVLISDIGMAERDGYDLILALRQRFDEKALPAIALTAFARAEDQRRALGAGFQLHMAKPVNPRDLTIAVASLLRGMDGRSMEAREGASAEARPEVG